MHLWKAFTVCLTVSVIVFSLLSAWVWYFGATAQPADADCIIVLGCRLYGKVPSPFLKARLDEAIRLYQAGYAQYVIVSGGQGPGEDISEAQAMKDYLVRHGIRQQLVIKEDMSTSTLTNLLFSKDKMKEYRFHTAIIVSNSYHLARSFVIADRLGLEASYSGVNLPQYKDSELVGFIREIPLLIYSLYTTFPSS